MVISVKGIGQFHTFDFDVMKIELNVYRCHLAEQICPASKNECEMAIAEKRAPKLDTFRSQFRDGEYLFLTCPYDKTFTADECFDIYTDIRRFSVDDRSVMGGWTSIHEHFVKLFNYCSTGAKGARFMI
jgi:hypothetical protein